jgi:hypothetical protein
MTSRLSLTAALLITCALSRAAVIGDPVASFITKNCLECHDHDTAKGNLDLQNLSRDLSDLMTFKRWEKIHDRVRAGEMPPKTKKTRPTAAEAGAAMDALTAILTETDLARLGNEGRAKVRRLTRTEIDYTLQDLFALPGMSVKEDLPEDGISAGFDKVSEALDVSSVQMARYMDMAHFVLDRAIATQPEAPEPFKRRFYGQQQYILSLGLESGECVLLKDKKRDPSIPLLAHRIEKDERKAFGKITRASESAIGIFRSTDESFNPAIANFSPLMPGYYKCRMSIWSFFWSKGEVLPSKKVQVVAVSTDHGETFHLDAPSIDSKVHEFVLWLEPNDRISFDLASMENVQNYSRKGCVAEYEGPGIALDWFDVEGPIYPCWPPESNRRIFGDLPLKQIPQTAEEKAPKGKKAKTQTPDANVRPVPARLMPPSDRRRDARYPDRRDLKKIDGVWTVQPEHPSEEAERLLRPLLTRLFRRPVTDVQLARYVALVKRQLAAGDYFEEAMRMAITGALCSPEFLYRRETPGKLDDWAVANRLSYLLWDSAPDDALNELAAQGKLHAGGEVVRAQVRRMLADPKSQRFIKDFLGQWLALKEIAATTPDKMLYPEFVPYMQQCMVNETRAYFRVMIDENLGVRNFVTSDFAMLNGELCKIYALDLGLQGSELKKVTLPPNSHRGGILTQGAILKITANGTTTSPVKRGAWIMDRLLGKPPEPPPPTVTAIEPDLRGTTTIRQQLDAHRHEAVCAGCHRHIDPPGFALESYDVIGGWRERYRSKEEGDIVNAKVAEGHREVKYRLALPVDCTGQSAAGEPFKNVDEFRVLLLKDQRQLARNFLRRMAIYATGRDITFADRPAIEAILDKCEVKDANDLAKFGNYRLKTMIEELAVSDLFLSK